LRVGLLDINAIRPRRFPLAALPEVTDAAAARHADAAELADPRLWWARGRANGAV
jgi:hypothetical protein